jgi:indolepyruvate ferredoxin oxidoreductase beta subunit
MSKKVKQQILISGVGGQGVLFVTGLLAEAAINKGLSVFTSETHRILRSAIFQVP